MGASLPGSIGACRLSAPESERRLVGFWPVRSALALVHETYLFESVNPGGMALVRLVRRNVCWNVDIVTKD